MQITPLELGLAVAAIVVAFGPRKLPNFKRPSVEVAAAPTASSRPLVPSQFAAGRAPSPLSMSVAHDAAPAHQFAVADESAATPRWRPAPLPYEF